MAPLFRSSETFSSLSIKVCVIEAPRQSVSKHLQVNPDALTPRYVPGPGTALVNPEGMAKARAPKGTARSPELRLYCAGVAGPGRSLSSGAW